MSEYRSRATAADQNFGAPPTPKSRVRDDHHRRKLSLYLPLARVDWDKLRGCAPRARASSARRAFIGEQLMLVLMRS